MERKRKRVLIGVGVAASFVALVAFILFLFVKAMNKMKKKEAAPAVTPEEVILLREIRDALKK